MENIQQIKKIIEKVLEVMDFSCQVEYEQEVTNQNTIEFNIVSKTDSSFLIGKSGVNLHSLQHIIRMIVKKQLDSPINFTIDVNSYKKEKNSSIIEQARTTAKQAIDQKRSIVMKPMTAYERRLVHMELADNDSVKTASLGEGEDRKIVVKPISEI